MIKSYTDIIEETMKDRELQYNLHTTPNSIAHFFLTYYNEFYEARETDGITYEDFVKDFVEECTSTGDECEDERTAVYAPLFIKKKKEDQNPQYWSITMQRKHDEYDYITVIYYGDRKEVDKICNKFFFTSTIRSIVPLGQHINTN